MGCVHLKAIMQCIKTYCCVQPTRINIVVLRMTVSSSVIYITTKLPYTIFLCNALSQDKDVPVVTPQHHMKQRSLQ